MHRGDCSASAEFEIWAVISWLYRLPDSRYFGSDISLYLRVITDFLEPFYTVCVAHTKLLLERQASF